ncbi:MAG TPA: SRPBCC family protein [Hanamia sp.]|nr:SRPBCC family protein [Hanamia sp.]
MPLIELQTKINSKIEICFDLSRSIELHKISTAKTNETAVDGVTKGLIGKDQFVTWKARHFGITQNLTTMITSYNRPFHFSDEQIAGIFKKLKHDHFFALENNMVLMTDKFLFESPFGFFGDIFNKLVLTKYLKKFLIVRNEMIKDFAETDKWKQLLL